MFALSDTEDNIFESLNRAGIAVLPLLRTLLAIRQKSQKASFFEVMKSFLLLANENFGASRILLQQLIAFLNFVSDSDDSDDANVQL